jgi:predicted lactoylglutathione lyase
MARTLYVNLAIKDVKRSRDFFAALGFEFDPRFSNENAACMIVSDDAYVMLLEEPFFKTFTERELCDTTRRTEGLFALSCENREEVNQMVEKAVAAGGSHAMPPLDHGFMYGWSFYDPDGHHWEVGWMDPDQMPSHT